MAPSDGWEEYKRLVLDKLDDLERQFDQQFKVLNEQVTLLRIEVAVLKLRSGLWGGLAGAVTVGVPLLIWVVVHFLREH